MCHVIYYIPECECQNKLYPPEEIESCANRPVSAISGDLLGQVLECPFLTAECGGMLPEESCARCYGWMDEEPED